jgi:hypothetical protein
MKASMTWPGLAFLLALPAAFAGPAADARQDGATAARAQPAPLCGQRCRHEPQGQAALNYIATPRPIARD